MQCRPCGSWLASDGEGAGSASPASRLPQVMGAVQALWELACQRWGGLQAQHRRQAGSHRYWVQCRPDGRLLARDGAGAESASPASRLPQVLGAVHALWELACQRWGRCRVSIAGKPAPTGNGCSAGLMGDGLPGMGRVAESASPASRLPQVSGAAQARYGAGCRVSIAGKPAPTGIGCSAGFVGAGLPAMGRVAGLSSPQAAPSG